MMPAKADLAICSSLIQGRIWDLLRGGANPEIVSLKQGVWGAQPPRSYRVFYFA